MNNTLFKLQSQRVKHQLLADQADLDLYSKKYLRLLKQQFMLMHKKMLSMITQSMFKELYTKAQAWRLRQGIIEKAEEDDPISILAEYFEENFDGYPDDWWDMPDFERKFDKVLSIVYGDAAAKTFKTIGIDIKLGIEDPKIKEFITSRKNFIKGLPEEGFKTFQTMFKDLYYDKGLNPLAIAGKLKKEGIWDEYYKGRSKTIARTEARIAQGSAREGEAVEAGMKNKIWLGAMDAKMRDSHRENAELGEVPMDFEYPNGQMFAGDQDADVSEFINCRCSMAYTAGTVEETVDEILANNENVIEEGEEE
uniref:Putative capsid morphogenesis protein n=1 Tax=viral metagenome TaxID=1070528 RepID=A0A6M3KA37_9ZZZZ